MNVVLRDPFLSSLLNDVHHRLSPSLVSCLNFRKYDRSLDRCCGSCRFCSVSNSLLDVASLISRILGSGYAELNVFLVVDDEKHLYSTFMLDYLRSLYALVIQTYSRYKHECGLYNTDDAIGVLNPTVYNLNVLPVHEWRRLLREGTSSSVFERAGGMRFLFIDNCKYMFNDFYSELKHNTGNAVGLLASCVCSDDSHRIMRHQLPSSNIATPEVSPAWDTPEFKIHKDMSKPCGSSTRTLNHSSTFVEASGGKTNERPGVFIDQSPASPPSLPRRSLSCGGDTNAGSSLLRYSQSWKSGTYCGALGEIRDVDCLAEYEPSGEGCAVRDVMFFDNVMCCGTFDCLHFGHKYLLLVAFLSCSKSIHIGITASDALLQRKKNFTMIQSYEKRLEVVENYLSMLELLYGSRDVKASALSRDIVQGWRMINYHNCDFFSCDTDPLPLPCCGRMSYREFVSKQDGATNNAHPPPKGTTSNIGVTTFKLMDVYGPAAVVTEPFALVISPESLPGAEQVNELRRSKGLVGWPMLSGGFVLQPEFDCQRKNALKVSSSYIRNGLRSIS